MISDALLIKIVREMEKRWPRKQYEELLIELGLYSLSALRDDDGYSKLTKNELFLETLKFHSDELLSEIHQRRRFTNDIIDALANKGILLETVNETAEVSKILSPDKMPVEDARRTSHHASSRAKDTQANPKGSANILVVGNISNSQVQLGNVNTTQVKETLGKDKDVTRNKLKDWAVIVGPIVAILAALIGVWGIKIQAEIPISATKTAEAQVILIIGTTASQQTTEVPDPIQSSATPHILLPQCAYDFVEPPTPQTSLANFLTPIPTLTSASFHAVRITIPAINVDAPIVEGDSWDHLKKGIGHHIGSADPGSSGNIVLVGHNDSWGEILRNLNMLRVDDQIIIQDGAGRNFVYWITKIETVDETMVSILDNTPGPILTLITCHPYMGDTKRLIITAKLH
jgi:LPXTG-site transpeptidase (sortase) family protein